MDIKHVKRKMLTFIGQVCIFVLKLNSFVDLYCVKCLSTFVGNKVLMNKHVKMKRLLLSSVCLTITT